MRIKYYPVTLTEGGCDQLGVGVGLTRMRIAKGARQRLSHEEVGVKYCLTVPHQRSILFNRLARVWPRLSGCYLEGVPDLGRGLLGNNGGGLTGAMDWRFAVKLQLSINFVG